MAWMRKERKKFNHREEDEVGALWLRMTSPSTAEGTKRKAEDDEEENATEEHHDILEETRARAEADHGRRRSQR